MYFYKINLQSIDFFRYVQIKKVGGGERRECQIITGVVCSKNLSHRKMPTSMKEPRILLLSSPIMFQRDEGKYLGLEPVIMQVCSCTFYPFLLTVLFQVLIMRDQRNTASALII